MYFLVAILSFLFSLGAGMPTGDLTDCKAVYTSAVCAANTRSPCFVMSKRCPGSSLVDDLPPDTAISPVAAVDSVTTTKEKRRFLPGPPKEVDRCFDLLGNLAPWELCHGHGINGKDYPDPDSEDPWRLAKRVPNFFEELLWDGRSLVDNLVGGAVDKSEFFDQYPPEPKVNDEDQPRGDEYWIDDILYNLFGRPLGTDDEPPLDPKHNHDHDHDHE